ncbi:hypothetical protein BT69DRAFT_1280481 [Atractiella rhizophila]|nr:hypothetical protein BT69DRAFT_1280481 [Atractiella rhizophila]
MEASTDTPQWRLTRFVDTTEHGYIIEVHYTIPNEIVFAVFAAVLAHICRGR